MEYTVQKLGRLAGVSSRTLRYYDEIGILKPARINSSGYRIYGQAEVNRLQQILFYRELGLSLEQIGEIVTSPDFDSVRALKEHRVQLLDKRKQLDQLITNVDKTIAQHEGRATMTDEEKFEGFKREMIEKNEQQYGEETRAKYGNEAVDKAYRKVAKMTKEDHRKAEQLGKEVKALLAEALQTGDPAGELAQQAAALHKEWLMHFWDEYTPEAHAMLAQMYVDDERFAKYYDKEQPGVAVFLRDAIHVYTGWTG